jgi:hypothetical protein
MQPFELSDQGTDEKPSSERLQAFTEAMWKALVPPRGECVSVQGEMIRGNDRLMSELLRNGMGNYYHPDETTSENYYGQMLMLILDTLIENKNGPLSAEDVAAFTEIRRRVEPDRARALRLAQLEDSETELTPAEQQELEGLAGHPENIDFGSFFHRAERCIANWCIANPELVDRNGKPVEERGLRNVEHVFNPPPPPEKCKLCGGKGFVQPEDGGFPKRCECQGPDPRRLKY